MGKLDDSMPIDTQLVAAVRGVWNVRDLGPSGLLADHRFQTLAEYIRQRFGGGRLAFSLSNALRNLGAPCALRAGTSPSREPPEIVTAALLRAFSATTTVRRHLCPLDLSDDLPALSFGPARIDNFTIKELESLFNAERLERNYPGRPVDFARLTKVQWLVLEEEVAVDPRAEARAVPFFFQRIDTDFGAFDPLARRYPAVVEEALFCLLLAPWETWGAMTMIDWRGFHLPWVYTVDEDIAVQPAVPPDAASLTFEPAIGHSGDGEEVEYERPSVLQLDPDDVQALTSGMSEAWAKLEIARSTDVFRTPIEHFMVRAYASTGIDEMLAHMTMLEAAVGEEADHDRKLRPKSERALGATERMARRIACLLDDPSAEQAYRDLFRVRSLFIHGRAGLATISTDERIMARRLARRAANALLERASSSAPSRSEVLAQLLDRPDHRELTLPVWADF